MQTIIWRKLEEPFLMKVIIALEVPYIPKEIVEGFKRSSDSRRRVEQEEKFREGKTFLWRFILTFAAFVAGKNLFPEDPWMHKRLGDFSCYPNMAGVLKLMPYMGDMNDPEFIFEVEYNLASPRRFLWVVSRRADSSSYCIDSWTVEDEEKCSSASPAAV